MALMSSSGIPTSTRSAMACTAWRVRFRMARKVSTE